MAANSVYLHPLARPDFKGGAFKYDPSISNEYFGSWIYKGRKKDFLVIGQRGTASAAEMVDKINLSAFTARLYDKPEIGAKYTTMLLKAMKKYPNAKVFVGGHSRGAAITMMHQRRPDFCPD